MKTLLGDDSVEEAFPPLSFLPILAGINACISLVYIAIGMCMVSSTIDTKWFERFLVGPLVFDLGTGKIEWFFLVFSGAWFVDSLKGLTVLKVARSQALKGLIQGYVSVDRLWRTDSVALTYVARMGVAVNASVPLVLWWASGCWHVALVLSPFLVHAAVGAISNHFKDGLFKIFHARINLLLGAMIPENRAVQNALQTNPYDAGPLSSAIQGEASLADLGADWATVTDDFLKLTTSMEDVMAIGKGNVCVLIVPALMASGALGVFFVVMACVLQKTWEAVLSLLLAAVYSYFALSNLRGMAKVSQRLANTRGSSPFVPSLALMFAASTCPTRKPEYDRFLLVLRTKKPTMKIEGLAITDTLIFRIGCVIVSHVPVVVSFARAILTH